MFTIYDPLSSTRLRLILRTSPSRTNRSLSYERSLRIAAIISGDRLWSSWSAGLAMTRLLTGWRPYKALIHVDRLHEYLLGLLETPKLTKDNLGIEEVNKFIVHIHILIRAHSDQRTSTWPIVRNGIKSWSKGMHPNQRHGPVRQRHYQRVGHCGGYVRPYSLPQQ